MKLTIIILFLSLMQVSATVYSQSTKFTFTAENKQVVDVLRQIEANSNFRFFYLREQVDVERKVTVKANDATVEQILDELFKGSEINYELMDDFLIVLKKKDATREGNDYPLSMQVQQQNRVSGTVTDESGEPLPGVNIVIHGTTQGTVTNKDGNFTIEAPAGSTLVFSFVGYKKESIEINGQKVVDVKLQMLTEELRSIVKIGYGTTKSANITGSVASKDFEIERASDVTVLESLSGAMPGLNIGQVDKAGDEPSISIRGRTSISGAQRPLIIVDDVMYRGDLIDLNPSDIESVDVLKDASAAAVYGSQASNGVVIISTKKASGKKGEPEINFSSQYAIQEPWREFKAQGPEAYLKKNELVSIRKSRTEESGYTERDPTWDPSSEFKTGNQAKAYQINETYDWYNWFAADPYVMKNTLSLANRLETVEYFTSIGFNKQQGHLRNEGYDRFNARINLNTEVTDWLSIDIQSFIAISDYTLRDQFDLFERYLHPFTSPYIINQGEVTDELMYKPYVLRENPLLKITADNNHKRMNLFGNITFNIDLPVKGLTYKGNFYNNYRREHNFYFGAFEDNFNGAGDKNYYDHNDMSSDHILSFERTFNEAHDFDITLMYGLEERNHNFTNAGSATFVNTALGYNKLQAGASDRQTAGSGGWKETSLYSMGRIIYAFNSKYLFSGILRRDGFSGFSEDYKFGWFPSASLGWVITEEPFFNELDLDWLSRLKLRGSYGTIGNRTLGRYQTLAKVSGGMNYLTAGDTESIYTQYISSFASPDLKWEKTLGINLGIDFRLLEGRINGSVDYYSKNTLDMLYNVDIPGITGFNKFPSNLGKLHNQGLELSLSSVNIQSKNFKWETLFTYSRNRNTIKELIGLDLDEDGQEDDLISQGLFIGESLGTIYDYKIDGIWQIDDDIPGGSDFGAYKVVDLNDDGERDPENDRTIIGNIFPAYRFSIQNTLDYKDWTFSFFLNSIQGGDDRYLGDDTFFPIYGRDQRFLVAYPQQDIDFWTPSNTDARYQNPGREVTGAVAGTRYSSRSFIRLQNVRLSYNFTMLGRYGIDNLRVFFDGKNLATWTDWRGWDPETGTNITVLGRPVMRSYTFGVNLSL